MTIRFQQRIALFTTVAAAAITFAVFAVIYLVVSYSSNYTLTKNIQSEKKEIATGITAQGDSLVILQMPEAEEAEHLQIEINPIFFQVVNHRGTIVFRSGNLQQQSLPFDVGGRSEMYSNQMLYGKHLLQGQFAVRNASGQTIGWIVVAVSQQESYHVLRNLLITLAIAYPAVLAVLYFVIAYAASKAILPVHRLIQTASMVNNTNIHNHIALPSQQDEIYQLTVTINELFSRIEQHIAQQKQFTADAAHEMRTPLTAIRGHLEVLIRKKRTPEEYLEKVKEVLGYVDRLNQLFDQLLHLSSLEGKAGDTPYETIPLKMFLEHFLQKWQGEAARKNIRMELDIAPQTRLTIKPLLFEGMMNNLVSNAIKYGHNNGSVRIACHAHTLSIQDDGPGIAREHQPHLFNRFYRTDASRSSVVTGTGLGLAVVKRLADIQNIEVTVQSEPGKGTCFLLLFPAASFLSKS